MTPTSAPVIVETTNSPHARLRPVPLWMVRLEDDFWEPRRHINRQKTLPSQHRHLEETGRIDNFRRAAGKIDGEFQGLYSFNDSDVYKWLEAASWQQAYHPDMALMHLITSVAEEVVAAQRPDGYLNSYFALERAGERYTNLKDLHELYCAGHFIQAAVAHHRATGIDTLLLAARRLADHLCETFGPASEGKREITDGHEEIEMALVELARETSENRYRELARFFIDVRGHGTIGGSPYHQDYVPFREMERLTGHAVRAVYYCCGAADLALETGDESLRQALKRLWEQMVEKQLYVSGGIGSRYEGEAFGRDYELPNERAYTETCAAIGSVMWCWRMLLREADPRYADLMEWTLYNAVLPGLSLDGESYFYQNPLADDGTHRRKPWFGCACCPPNVARLLSSLPGYFYTVSENAVWAHLYARGSAELTLPDGRQVRLRQETRYPWDGAIEITVETEGDFALNLRVPTWCDAGATVTRGGSETIVTPGTYVALEGPWAPGETVRLHLRMPVRQIECYPYAEENRGKVALARGPVLYCLESTDNPGMDLRDVVITEKSVFAADTRTELPGMTVLHGNVKKAPPGAEWSGRLYRTAHAVETEDHDAVVTAVPYFAWANRDPGQMRVWITRTAIRPL